MINYFWLTQDKQSANIQPYLSDTLVSIRSKMTGEFPYLPRISHTTFAYNFDPSMEFDLLDMGLFMITDKIKKVFDPVLPNLEYREFCITTNQWEKPGYYYAPMIPKSATEFNRIPFDDSDNQSTLRISIDFEAQMDIFKISDDSGTYVIVSLIVAEKLLQIGAKNIRLIPTQIVTNKSEKRSKNGRAHDKSSTF